MALELRQLRYFAAVAEVGNVNAAAQRLFLTQPALSQSLQQLERSVGIELLRRHRRGVELTPAGHDFLVEARGCIDAADRALAAAARHACGHHEELTVGYLHEAFAFLIEPLQRFARARPDVRLNIRELDFESQDSALREGRVDAAVLGPPPPDAHVHVLSREEVHLVLAVGHPLAERASLTLDAVGDVRFPRFPPGTPRYHSDQWTLTTQRGAPARLTETALNTVAEGVAAIAAGRLVGAAPAFLAGRYCRGFLTARPITDAAPAVVGLAWLRCTPPLQAFLETLRAMGQDQTSSPSRT